MKDLKNKKKKEPINRFLVLLGIMLFIFFVIFARLIYLQVFKYAEYSDRANTRSRRFLAEKAPRGKIYDAEGNLLATNVQTYTVTFTETDEANKDFFTTITKVFKILDENGEKQIDDFKLKINDDNKPYFDFGTSNPEIIKAQEIRFKRDRGLNDIIRKKLFPKKEGDLTDEEENQINEKLIAITPTQTFDYLIKQYKLYGLLNPTDEEAKKFDKISPEEIAKKLEGKYSLNTIRRYMIVKDAMKMQSFSGFKPVTIAANVNKDTAFIFLQKLNDLPGINVNLEPMRYYPYHDLASSVIGYVSSINPDKKSRYEERGYDVSSDLIGMSGVEGSFENILKGTKGGTTVKVNSSGRKVEELFKLEPSPGENIHLSIDKNIQYSAEKMLQRQLEYLQGQPSTTKNATRGAAVAIEVKTGRVLAMVSYPTFDPNVFSTPGALTPSIMKKYFNTDLETFGNDYIKRLGLAKSVDDLFPKDNDGNREDKYDIVPKPMYNYATMGLTPPGSTFKPMTAVAALQDGVITPNEAIPEKMHFNEHPEVFGKAFAPADNADHGANIDVKKAIAVSCNHFFYECAYRMYMKEGKDIKSLNSIADFAWQAGLGVNPNSKEKATTGIEISENFGQVYNFQSFKNQTVYYSKYELVSQLKDGNMGSYRFPSMDIGYNEDDSDGLKKAKSDIKDLVANRLKDVGTDNFEKNSSSFNRDVKFKIEDFTKVSSAYKDSISKYESSGKKYSVNTVVAAVEQFILNKKAEMTSPAQLIYSAIGQGINAFTPVQLASYISTVVNGGTRYKIHLVDKITNEEGKAVDDFKPEVMNKINIEPQYVEAIKQGMQMTNTSGTGSSVFANFPISTGGKTGTATFQKGQEDFGRAAFGVYVSFAPVDDPKVAVAVVLYDGAHGYFGAPVARAIYETYFRDDLKKNYPGYTPIFMGGGTYDYSLTPPLQDIKDDGVHKSEAEQKIQQQQEKEKEQKLEINKEELKKKER